MSGSKPRDEVTFVGVLDGLVMGSEHTQVTVVLTSCNLHTMAIEEAISCTNTATYAAPRGFHNGGVGCILAMLE